MLGKRKKIVLTLYDKLEIIKNVRNGKSRKLLAAQYGIGLSTITDIMNNYSNIVNFLVDNNNMREPLARRTIKVSSNKELDEVVYSWFLQKRARGYSISESLLQEKAKIVNNMNNNEQHAIFKASTGWLTRFKARHGLSRRILKKKYCKVDLPLVSIYKQNLRDAMIQYKYDEDTIYNADEIGLHWERLSVKFLPSQGKSANTGRHERDEYLTLVACANASGTHRIPLFCVSNINQSDCKVKNNNNEPSFILRYQKAGCITRMLFTEWYKCIFIPAIQQYHNSAGTKKNILLILDNSPCHHPVEHFSKIDDMIKIIYLPPKVTRLLQPMDQGIIQVFKRNYRMIVERQLLLDDDKSDPTQFSKCFDFNEACDIMSAVWSKIDQSVFKKSWYKLLDPRNSTT